MNKPFNDGGLAFPCPPVIHADHGVLTHGASGMSMREWYAATVSIDGLEIAERGPNELREFLGDKLADKTSMPLGDWFELVARATAKARFLQADAMIAESMRRPE